MYIHLYNKNIYMSGCACVCILESFNLWRPLVMIALYYQTKTPIGFLCRRGLNTDLLLYILMCSPMHIHKYN